MDIKAVIFDFDGVLADSFRHVYALNKKSMAKVGTELSKDQYRDFFMGNIHAAFRSFIKDDGAYKKFSELRQRDFGKYYSAVKLFPGAEEFIKDIKNNFSLAIVSSGDGGWIMKLLKSGNIQDCFRFIDGSADHSKKQKINLVLERLKLRPEEAMLISDTCGDITLAKKLGLKTIGVGWGFHSLSRLQQAGSEFVAENFDDLYRILDNF